MKTKHSFSRRLSLRIVIFTSILFIVVLSIAALYSHKLIADEATKSATNLLDASIKDIEKTLLGVEYSVINSAWNVEEHKYDVEYLYHITREIVLNNPDVVGSSIAFKQYYLPGEYYFSPYSYVDSNGLIDSKQLGSPQYDYFYMDWYQIPFVLGEPCWSEPYYDDGGGEYLMSTYSYPIKDDNGDIYAIITADISLEHITKLLEGIKPYKSSNVTLVSRSGSYITLDKEKKLSGETIFSTALYSNVKGALDIATAMSKGQKGVMRYFSKGQISFAVIGPLSNGWSASVTCSYREVLAASLKMYVFLIILGLLSIVALFLVTLYTTVKETKPLSDFTNSANSIAKGDFSTVLPEIDTQDEVQQLRDSFDYMQKSLTNYIDNLKISTAANERFKSELNIASKIQMAMLSKQFPKTDKVDLHALLIPAKEVGGDLYDFFIKDDNLYFTVGDVSGKGVPASMFMAITRSAFRFIAGMDLPMDQVVSKINDSVCNGNESGMFVTMFVGKLNLSTGEFEYCNAGHNPIVLNGEFLDVKPNLAIGLFEGFPYQRQTTKIEKGSRFILYTDGVTEAERADKAQFGDDSLIKWANSHKEFENSMDACTDLFFDVTKFTEGNEQNDDITIMTIIIK